MTALVLLRPLLAVKMFQRAFSEVALRAWNAEAAEETAARIRTASVLYGEAHDSIYKHVRVTRRNTILTLSRSHRTGTFFFFSFVPHCTRTYLHRSAPRVCARVIFGVVLLIRGHRRVVEAEKTEDLRKRDARAFRVCAGDGIGQM